MICPICKRTGATAGHILGHSTSAAKAKASAENGKRGGRPRRQRPEETVSSVGFLGTNKWRIETASMSLEIECTKPPKVGDVLKIKKDNAEIKR